ncbi:MAG: HEAT repeat domain-containing protein [Planctomycetia bacterium]|nr:HEAT repeat domain-containing protein [Planctomycetia bacterium]
MKFVPRYLLAFAIMAALGGCQSETTYEGRTLAQWVRDLDTREIGKRESTIEKLVSIGDEAKPALIAALVDHDEEVRAGAATALLRIDPSAKTEVLRVMETRGTEYRLSMAIALVRTNIELPAAIEVLKKTLHDRDPRLNHHALKMFSEFSLDSAAAVPALIEMLRGEDALERRTAALALVRIGKPAAEAVPALVQALSSDDAALREGAAQALGAIGEGDESAIAALEAAKDDKDSNVRFRVLQALRILWPTDPARPPPGVLHRVSSSGP